MNKIRETHPIENDPEFSTMFSRWLIIDEAFQRASHTLVVIMHKLLMFDMAYLLLVNVDYVHVHLIQYSSVTRGRR